MPFAQQVLALRELSCPNRLTRDELAYILDTFPIVRRKDEGRWGEYRTKRLVLEAFGSLKL